METIIVIPARLASTRLPNKVIEKINGIPMILHVIEVARQANIGPVLVASADQEISDVVRAQGVEAVQTNPDLPSGTDRIAAALNLFDPSQRYTHVINIQADLPTLSPRDVFYLNQILQEYPYDIATLAAPSNLQEAQPSSVVKAVLSIDLNDKVARGLYFSRSLVASSDGQLYHHIGVYGYQRYALERFVSLPPSPLEKFEKLEQLRAIEDGMKVGVGIVPAAAKGVDVLQDLMDVKKYLEKERPFTQ